ncbi:hypothetical protein LIER_31824 [Lithospermum erythrorhizon]|uniref:Late embryogenesis abundant protein LEA-2 subgroup domain-containing protein n=1 Tax=Lithospermum erythrorhizon TaxID=34254 RepID=A0AAV3RS39_LITER
MSQIHEISPKHCAKKQGFTNNKKFNKKFLCSFSTFLLSVLSLILLVYLTLHPKKPQFSLQQADIYQFNLSNIPNFSTLNSTIRLTLLSKNPNQRVGIYYDEIQVHASYKGQQITQNTPLPEFYQGHEDTNFLSASLNGIMLPVAPSFGYEVQRDQAAGRLMMNLKADGKLRWKVGTWVSGKYRFNVNCIAIIPFGSVVAATSGPLRFREGTQCSTTV